MQEFDVISRYFKQANNSQQNASSAGVLLDKGDDCAILQAHTEKALAMSTDTLVAGTHFLADMQPAALAHRALATNLSDLAAMGAKPKWFSLALTLPHIDEVWLAQFSQGLFKLADQYGIYLTGGDTTSGPLSITITVIGEVDAKRALTRHQAQADDLICVTGTLGNAAAALTYLLDPPAQYNEAQQQLIHHFDYPEPQIKAGLALVNIAHAALDISDGLIADLGHICQASQLAAMINVENLPLSAYLLSEFTLSESRSFALSGGDDYQLCFTVSPANLEQAKQALNMVNVNMQVVGQMQSVSHLNTDVFKVNCLLDEQIYTISKTGYEHFSL